jgi:aminoglycoside/choline kinase family phosphotransferase
MIGAQLESRMTGEPGLSELDATLREVAGSRGRLVAALKLSKGVYRISLATPSRTISVVAKRLAPSVAHRSQLALERWLPGARLEHVAPALLGVAAERGGGMVWHLYEDLGGATLADSGTAPAAYEAAVRLVAGIHARFAHDPVLAECRVWGEDHGIAFYDSSVRDAIAALSALLDSSKERTQGAAAAGRLRARLERLAEERDHRARALAELGGPDTLLHGDLWPKNTAVLAHNGAQNVRLLDWDKVGPGSFSYDLSTLALRVPAQRRAAVIEIYRRAAAEQGMRLPADSDLGLLFATAEYARLANIAIWPALIAAERGSAWALRELAEIEQWLGDVEMRCAA